jgi:hypothetical protein
MSVMPAPSQKQTGVMDFFEKNAIANCHSDSRHFFLVGLRFATTIRAVGYDVEP